MIRSALLLFLCVCGLSLSLKAQVIPDSAKVDTLKMDTISTDSLLTDPDSTQTFQAPEEKEAEPEVITVWHRRHLPGYNMVTNDSLLRWQIWPNWGEYYAYRNDVISFRQGTTGRVDAFTVSGFTPDEQKLIVNGVDLSDPITGFINYNFVPGNKVGHVKERMLGTYESEIILKDYYILEPVSYLNYEEAKFNFRNLEFMVTQNLSERTNLELSFWDRRDGDSYPNNEVIGSQVFGKLYHYLNQNTQIRALFLRNQFDREESFGYTVTDPLTFPFDQFAAPAKNRTASSEELRRDVIAGIYFRKDSLSAEHMGLEVSTTKSEYDMIYASDSLGWDLRTYETKAFKNFGLRNIELNLEAGAGYFTFNNVLNLSIDNWAEFFASGDLAVEPLSDLSIIGSAEIISRSDSYQTTEFGVSGIYKLSGRAEISISGSIFDRMPEIQSLYWDSKLYSGDPDLLNEQGYSVTGLLNVHFGERLSAGVTTRLKQIDNDHFLAADSSFNNDSEYSVISGNVFARFENYRFEVESSAMVEAFNNLNQQAQNNLNNFVDGKIWIRNNAWIKGYAFDRAAFLKAGVRTLFSPKAYRSRFYNTGAQFWQNNSTETQIPAFFRLDAEISARVRRIMVVMRWENTLDGIGQAGYFEAATFPMPARRFIVGIRAQFRN